MIRPVQITFRNMRPSLPLEDEIRARVAWLERYSPDLIGCRVLVEVPHRHRRHGRHVRVRIELSLPGEDAVVSHDTDIDAAHKHAVVAIHEAFDAARRRLEDFARLQRGDVKAHSMTP